MQRLFSILTICLLIYSCSKEEDIPFKSSDDDSLELISYYKIDGFYQGSIKDYLKFGKDSIIIVDSAAHSITVKEIDFNNVMISEISNKYAGSAETEIFRYDTTGGYLRFIPHTMADSTGIDSVFYSYYFHQSFNGIFYVGSKRIQYFFYFIQNKDTVYQFFDGTIQE